MAKFDINIGSKPELTYETANVSRASNTCDNFSQNTNIALVRGSSYDPQSGIFYVFRTLTSTFPLVNLRIRNVQYTDQSQLYVEDGGVVLQPSTNYTVDITTVNPDDLISNFRFVANNANTSTQSLQASFEAAVEDNQGNIGPYKTISLSYRRTAGCDDVKESITTTNLVVTDCETTATVTVNVPKNESRFVEIITTSGNVQVIPSITTETITASKSYALTIFGAQPATFNNSQTSKFTLLVRLNQGGQIIASEVITRTHSFNLC